MYKLILAYGESLLYFIFSYFLFFQVLMEAAYLPNQVHTIIASLGQIAYYCYRDPPKLYSTVGA